MISQSRSRGPWAWFVVVCLVLAIAPPALAQGVGGGLIDPMPGPGGINPSREPGQNDPAEPPPEPPAAEQVPPPAAPEPAPGSPPPAPAPGEVLGALQVLVVASETELPLPGARMQLGTLGSAETADDGIVTVTATPGSYPVSVTRLNEQGQGVTAQLGEVPIVANQMTLVTLKLSLVGAVDSLEIKPPEPPPPVTPSEPARARPEVDDANRPKGTVEGRVLSSTDKQPIVGAYVFVKGRPAETRTDEQGHFRLTLPEGSHELTVIQADFSTELVESVTVRSGQATPVNVEIRPSQTNADEFVIIAPRLRGSVAALMEARRQATSASDAIGVEDIARTPAGDAAGAAQRIVGVNVVGGRFVYVRGLGERYTNALLNGLPLPSPEPDRATIPLDIFPTQIVSSIDVTKTFTPDIPGDFAGGSVRIETVAVPERFVLSASIGTSFNTQSTFRERFSYKGGSIDWLGFDDGTRALPKEVRDRPIRLASRSNPEGLTRDEINALGPKLNSSFAVRRSETPPNVGGTFAIGNGWKFRKGRRFGLLAALNYAREVSLTPSVENLYLRPDPDGSLNYLSQAKQNIAVEQSRWAAFASTAYEFSKRHRIRLMGLRSQLADDETQLTRGFSENSDAAYRSTHLEFASRALNLGQLQGEHEWEALRNARLEWRVSMSNAARDQPDTRDSVFQETNENWTWQGGPSASRHFFSEQEERARAGSIDWKQPIKAFGLEHSFKLGGLVLVKDRDFTARSFVFRRDGAISDAENCGPAYGPVRCPEQLFTDDNVDGAPLRLDETTLPQDAYKADLDVYAGYLMVDVALARWLRLVGGARLEWTNQRIAEVDPFTGEENEEKIIKLEQLDPLPSGALIWSATDKLQVRGSVTRTIARPQLREMAPFSFSTFGRYTESGNPQLKLTSILNGDLRVEYFPTSREVIAASVFVKKFTDPIEPVFKPTGSNPTLSYENAKGAFLVGGEVEARQGLGFMSAALSSLTFIANLTLARSEIEVNQTGSDASGMFTFLTNTNRPMVYQAPYVVNLMLDYENTHGTQARILYNVSGSQLVQVGREGLDDAYLHPRHSLDLTASQKLWDGLRLKVTLQNLINPEYLVTQGPNKKDPTVTKYKDGMTGSISVGYSY